MHSICACDLDQHMVYNFKPSVKALKDTLHETTIVLFSKERHRESHLNYVTLTQSFLFALQKG